MKNTTLFQFLWPKVNLFWEIVLVLQFLCFSILFVFYIFDLFNLIFNPKLNTLSAIYVLKIVIDILAIYFIGKALKFNLYFCVYRPRLKKEFQRLHDILERSLEEEK